MSFFQADEVVDSRHDIEDALDLLLSEAGLGEVSGGGSGSGVAIIDIEVFDAARVQTVLEQNRGDWAACSFFQRTLAFFSTNRRSSPTR